MRIQKISPVEPIERLGKEKNDGENFREALRKAALSQSNQDGNDTNNGNKFENIREGYIDEK